MRFLYELIFNLKIRISFYSIIVNSSLNDEIPIPINISIWELEFILYSNTINPLRSEIFLRINLWFGNHNIFLLEYR